MNALGSAASLIVILELLPRAVRASGLSIAYAIGVSLFGGTTQFIVAWLTDKTGNPIAPAWYAAGTSVVAAVAILLITGGHGATEFDPLLRRSRLL